MNHRACTARLATEAGWTVTLLMGGQGDPVPLAAGTLPHFDALPMARGRSGAMDLLRSFIVIRRAMVDSDVCELVTLKPILIGMAAARTLPRRTRPRLTATFAGLGTVLDAGLKRRHSPFVACLRFVLQGRARVLVENPDDADALTGAGIARSTDIVVGPGVGLPASWLALPPNPVIAFAQQPLRVLYMGRLIASKGVPECIEAMRVLRSRRVDVTLTLAGALDDRNPSAIDRITVEGWERDGLVRWIGHLADPLTAYREADVVILASHREGGPRSLMEAQALGIPVVASDVPGCRQVVDAKRTGLLVPPTDFTALADAIEVLHHDPALRHRLGAEARKWAAVQFREERFLAIWAEAVLGARPLGEGSDALE